MTLRGLPLLCAFVLVGCRVEPTSTRDAIGTTTLTAASSGELEIYEWRGQHDFLFFEVRRGRVLRADWWNAWE